MSEPDIKIPKCLSVRQPWAHAIIHGTPRLGHKDVENRSWTTRYHGPLLIHAGRAVVDCKAAEELGLLEFHVHAAFGCIIGMVTLDGVVSRLSRDGRAVRRKSPWADDYPEGFYWLLKNPRAFSVPISCKGRLGLWTPAEDRIAKRLQVELSTIV